MRRRHLYWLTGAELEDLRGRLLEEERKRMTPVKGVPCKGFNELIDVSYVAPGEWDKVCRRQGGWYRESPRHGQYLVCSGDPLEGVRHRLETVIEAADFVPPRLPSAGEVARLAASGRARSRVPQGWEEITDRDRAHWRRLLATRPASNGPAWQASCAGVLEERTVGVRGPSRLGSSAELDDLLVHHTANHANFIEPRFFVERPGSAEPVPYSIGPTAEVCSACVELSGLVGGEFPLKYVMPCPGFVQFTGLPADRYLKVASPGK